MRAITVAAALVTLALAGPVFATDGGNGNAEQQTQPVPNRGNTSGGPAHGVNKAQAEEGNGEAAQCIWLARVRPEDCENIVRYTVLQGKVVKPKSQLRGGFDRSRQVVSW